MALFRFLEVVDSGGRVSTHSGFLDAKGWDSLPSLEGEVVRIYSPVDEESDPSDATLMRRLELALRKLKAAGQVSRRARFRSECVILSITMSTDEVVHKEVRELTEADSIRVLTDSISQAVTGHRPPLEFLQADVDVESFELVLRNLSLEPGVWVVPAGLPIDSPRSAQRREALAADWFDSESVGKLLGAGPSNPNQLATRLRREGKLLGVWIPSERGYRHPPCQFANGSLLPVMEQLLPLLPKASGSGWDQVEWLFSPHALLSKRRPADLLATEPELVLKVARREFTEDPNAGW